MRSRTIAAYATLRRARVGACACVHRSRRLAPRAQAGEWPRLDEIPGGNLEPGEDPAQAVIRETYEETGLLIAAPGLLRAWRYRNARGIDIAAHAFAAHAQAGDVVLSEEHTEHAWMDVDEYERRYCSEAFDHAAPLHAPFLAGMRENCRLFRQWIAAHQELMASDGGTGGRAP
jgi:8-oxo-dGTP pyrophosphatase MutT (NUDIX family)